MYTAIVIGAGPGGIVATKELLEIGIQDVLCLEQKETLGGVFARGYDVLTLTSSIAVSMFSDYLPKLGEKLFWTKDAAVEYWSDYAKHFGVTEHIRFKSEVVRVTRDQDKNWHIETQTGEQYVTKHLVLALGGNRTPKYPTWKDNLNLITYSHSQDFVNAERFRGKRVVVVGGAESGSDVALEISKVAAQTWISLRESAGWIIPPSRGTLSTDTYSHRGLWGLPKEYGAYVSKKLIARERSYNSPVFNVLAEQNEHLQTPWGIFGTYGTKTLSLPEAVALHGAMIVDDVTEVIDGEQTLKTVSGKVLEHVDHVVFCTGYKSPVAHFMPENLQKVDPRALYKHQFHPDYAESIAWIGLARPGFVSQFPIMEMQARLYARVCAGKHTLPGKQAMEDTAAKDFVLFKERFGITAERIRNLVDYQTYMDSLAKLIGCMPPFIRYLFLKPHLWVRIVYGPTQATQFRLQGPGAKRALAEDILKKLPLGTIKNVTVRVGIVCRILNVFRIVP